MTIEAIKVEPFPVQTQQKRFAKEYELALPLKAHFNSFAVKKSNHKFIESYIEYLERCAALEEEFDEVTLDKSAVRFMERNGNQLRQRAVEAAHTFQVPLIFTASLPAKPMTEIKIDHQILKSKTPTPTREASQKMREHGHKFDGLEIWWVPKDILIEEKDPDPILVGWVRPFAGYNTIYQGSKSVIEPTYFELHRWVDDVVEEGWWAKEAY
jgi:hypothetical protein